MHAANVPSQDELLQTFQRAGFSSFTPLQQRLIPLLLKGRDAIAEVEEGSGTSAALVAPLVLGLRGSGPSLRALLLLPTADDVAKVARAFARFARVVRDAPSFVTLGESEDARREERRLEREAAIVAGTVERVIDHIRRGSISFSSLQTLIVREPAADARADFVKDVQFIFAKCTERPRVVLITHTSLGADDEMMQILHHPLTLDVAERESAGAAAGSGAASSSLHTSILIGEKSMPESLARAVLGLRLPSLLAFHAPRTDAGPLVETLRTRGLRAAVLPPPSRAAARREMLLSFTRGAWDVVLAPLTGPVPPDVEAIAPSQFVMLDLPAVSIRSPAGMLKRASVLALGERDRDLQKLQEAFGVAFDRKDIPDDEALLAGVIERVLSRIKDEDRGELERLRSQIRRKVPLLTRPLFMAALLKSMLPARAAEGGPAARPAGARPRGVPAPRRGPSLRFPRAVSGDASAEAPRRRGAPTPCARTPGGNRDGENRVGPNPPVSSRAAPIALPPRQVIPRSCSSASGETAACTPAT